MTWRPGDLENPATEIELHHLIRPGSEAEEVHDRTAVLGDHCRIRTAFELAVTADMVEVPVSVCNHQWV